MTSFNLITFFTISLFCFLFKSQNSSPLNYYSIPNNLTFDNRSYKLSWSAHPDNFYYKQEYLPKGEKADHFEDMLLIDFLITDLPVKDVVQSQIISVNERKKTDLVCNYQVAKNAQTGEYIIDFIYSETKENRITIVEWNAYHYKRYSDSLGHKGVILFGISHRSYDSMAIDFLKRLAAYRRVELKKLSDYPVPVIQIK